MDDEMRDLHGPPLPDVPALTTGGFLREVAARHGNREALVFDDPLAGGETIRWTYQELWQQSRRVARALLATGTGKGSRVGVLMANRPESVAALFGAGLAGCIAVPLSTFATAHELDHLLRHSDVSVLLTQTAMGKRSFVADVLSLVPAAQSDHVLHEPAFPFLRRVAAVGPAQECGGIGSWEAFLALGDTVDEVLVDAVADQVSPYDLGLVIYSSGTTDHPKGILHNHRSPTLQFWVQAEIFGRTEQTRMWTALPFFWTAGLNTALGATLAAGGCCILQEGFEPGEALRLMAREKVTEPYTLPHQAAALEEHPDWAETDLSSLTCVYGKSVFTRHPRVSGDPSWNMPVGYGLTETCAFVVAHPSTASREQLRSSLGRLLPGNVLRVIDPDSGRPVATGADGELLLKGPTLMEQYVKRGRDASIDPDGFFHTGDIGHVDDRGFVHWTGRRTEMIKTGGANVSPAEIEVQLRACPPVKLARVLGVPDPRLEQIAVLCVELKDGAEATEEDITQFLRQRVASYKVPKRILFFADGEIPLTASQTKVRDEALLALVLDRL